MSFPSHRHTNRFTDTQMYTIASSDTLHIHAKFELCTPIQSKATFFQANSSDYPLPSLKTYP